jgi:hypothetical protein
MKIILWKTDKNVVAVTYPAPGLDLHEVAKKSVGHGKAYYIVDSSVLPDFAFRDAWELDASAIPDGVGEAQ